MFRPPPRDNSGLFTKLTYEKVAANGQTCSECGNVGPDDTLSVYTTWRGNRPRQHSGQFCSKLCHDRYHGLAPRKG
jgi:hypothetical protein